MKLDPKFIAKIAGTLLVFLFTRHASADIARLFMYCCKDTARIAIKLVFRLCISYTVDCPAGNGLQVDICFRRNLAHDDNLACGYERFDSAMCSAVIRQELVEESVTNLVGHFVWMAF